MARWSLQADHYLMTDPATEYEYKETSRETGRQTRMVNKVPRYLNTKDPADWTDGDQIIVSDGKGLTSPKDVIFLGDPTPDMKPIDEDAKRITQEFIDSGKWKRPEEGEVFGEGLIKMFMEQIGKLQAGQIQAVPVPSVDAKAFADLQAQVQVLIEQNAKLQAVQAKRTT